MDITTLEHFSALRERMLAQFSTIIGPEKLADLVCEGNNYADNSKCGIGFHGDAERRRVIAIRIGAPMPMKWQWFHKSLPVGQPFEYIFDGGDVYIMSEKAVGTDWRSSSKHTLRHAAGCSKYTTIIAKKPKKENKTDADDKKRKREE